jgi:hypothetical protein
VYDCALYVIGSNKLSAFRKKYSVAFRMFYVSYKGVSRLNTAPRIDHETVQSSLHNDSLGYFSNKIHFIIIFPSIFPYSKGHIKYSLWTFIVLTTGGIESS